MVRGARAQGERVGHNDTVNYAQTTSENIELVPLQEDDSTRRIPIISWRLITAVLAALAMVAILFWIPVPFVVNSPGPTFNVRSKEQTPRRGSRSSRTSLNPARTTRRRSRGRGSCAW